MTVAWTNDLQRHLAPSSDIPTERPPRWSPRLNATSLQRWSSTLSIALTVLTGTATAVTYPNLGIPPLSILSLTGIAVAVAGVLRRGLRRGGGGGTLSPEPLPDTAMRAVIAEILAIIVVGACVFLLLPATPAVLLWAASWLLLSASGVVVMRFGAAWLAAHHPSASLGVVVIGPADRTAPLAAIVATSTPKGWRLVAELRETSPEDHAQLAKLLADRSVDVVVLAMAGSDPHPFRDVCEILADSPVRVCLGLDVQVAQNLPLASLWREGLPVVDLVTDPHGGFRGAVKLAVDLMIATTALILLAPILAALALAIRLESPGPAFFRQRRFGIGSVPIEILKFRTMRNDTSDISGERRTIARDPRVTPLGRILRRTSLDELPQLINVLRGDMSLVGPRPHPLHMKVGGAYYFQAVQGYRFRHRVKPGITGWAQVNGSRGEVDTMEKARRRIELDLWYIQHWSLTLDLRVLLRTALGGFTSLKAD